MSQELSEKKASDTPEQEVPAPEEDKKSGGKSVRKAAAGAAAGLAAASLLIGNVFSNPAEVMEKVNPDEGRPAVVVQYEAKLDEDMPAEEEEDEGEEKKRGLKDMIKRFIQGLPSWAKVLFVIPLWAIGYGITAVVTALFEPVIAPVLSVVLKWLLIAGLLAGGFFLIKKAVAPDTPIREIFSKRNIILIIIAAAVLGAADFFAKAYFEKYVFWRNFACFAAGILILGFYALRTWNRKKKEAAAAA